MVNNLSDKKGVISTDGSAKQKPTELSGDRPLTNPEDDRLGYAPFAKHLAKVLSEMVSAESIVISVNGPWGFGKTTVLNFIECYLKRIEEGKRIEVIHFNPWWFSGERDLVTSFFQEMTRSLDPKDATKKKIRKSLADLCEVAGGVPIPGSKAIGTLGKKINPKTKSLHELRGEVEKQLLKAKIRFIVVVDDIDRLMVDEIRNLFKVVKAVANLPNIIYILAFDKERVAKAVEEFHLGSGKEYLDKIIQVPFDLPLQDKSSIRQLLFEKLDKVLGPLNDSEFDQQRWANIYLDGIDPLIRTPRDVMRLFNSISVTFPSVQGEVNVVDFIAIEATRVFLPEVYEAIRSNIDEFTGTSERDSKRKDEREGFHQDYLDKIEEKLHEPTKLLLQRLFPKLERVSYASSFEREWRQQLRVCSSEVFPVFFRLQLAEGDIGAVEMRRFLDISSDRAEVVKYLRPLITQKHKTGITRARALLERLEDYTEKEIPKKNIKSILLALFDVGDELRAEEPDRRMMYDFGVEMQVARIIYQLLNRCTEEERFDLMKIAVNEGMGIITAIYEVSLLDERAEKTKEPDSSKDNILLPSGEVEELKNLAVDRITNESEKESLLKCVKLSFVLYCWKIWDKSNKYQEWINKMKSRRDFIVPLLTSNLGITFSAGMGIFGLGDRVAKREYRIDLNFIKEFMGLDEIKTVVEVTLNEESLSDRERLALETFLKDLERSE